MEDTVVLPILLRKIFLFLFHIGEIFIFIYIIFVINLILFNILKFLDYI